MKKLFFLLIILLSVIVNAQDGQAVEVPKITVRIPLGEVVQMGDVTIKFKEVLEDSRCPENVVCIWAGRVRILVEIKIKGTPVQNKELLFGQIRPGESKDTSLYASEGYLLKGVAVVPYPNSEDRGERSYVLLVSEIKQ